MFSRHKVSTNISCVSTAERRQLNSAFCDCCSSAALPAGAVQYAIGGPSERGVNAGDTNAMAYSAAAGQGRSSPRSPASLQ